MMKSGEHRIRRAFDELRTEHSTRTPGFESILDRRARRRHVRPATWSMIAVAILAAVVVARGARPDEAQSIATWQAPSDELIETSAPWNEPDAGSSALNELLPATLQIGGGQ